jgi:hypothetical protein
MPPSDEMPGSEELAPPPRIDVPMRVFLESYPPGSECFVPDVFGQRNAIGLSTVGVRSVSLHCSSKRCGGVREFGVAEGTALNNSAPSKQFLTYRCRNCGSRDKTYALLITPVEGYTGAKLHKVGEFPPYGDPIPSRLVTMIGPERELFLKGRRAENQGLGIAAFAYYRRVVESQKNRIFDEIIKVCTRLGANEQVIQDLEKAKLEIQFTKSVESVKHAIPQSLLINGHSPLTLLHSALSEGLHARSDEECLTTAAAIRVVLAGLAERISFALTDHAELNSAVTQLLKMK